MEHRIIRRLFAIAPLCALTACATAGSVQSSELAELKAEVRAMRETQSRLEKRLERMELQASVSQSRASAVAREGSAPAAAPAATASSGSGYSTPELAVVKLKPRNEPAPPLPTRVAVVEPAPDDMEMFISSAPEGDSGSAAAEASEPREELDAAVLDAEFEQAVAALRTGNVEGGVTRLLAFAAEHPRHPRADNALYFSGLGQMGLKDHASAVKSFERLIASYPAGDAVLDGMLRLAECRLRLNQKDDARALYTRILTQFPGTAAATQAEQRLASLH
ncbi:tetratricopeptide repeat protein [Archangium gephyra]|uniref:tetratricopeptide repeat protein n=1 Tax=Archangium gephyra TaxID=48 RepID=UPI003B76173B